MINEKLINKISNNFDTEMEESITLYKVDKNNVIVSMINESFNNSIKILKENIKNKKYQTKEIKYGYFPTAGDPIHWAHILTIFKILAEYSLNKIIIISGGHDARKPKLIHPDIRFPIIKTILNIFEGLFDLSNITLKEECANQIGENNIFNCLKKENELISAYYIVGSDHFKWFYNDKYGNEQPDTLTVLSSNIKKYKDLLKHKIRTIFILRDGEEIETIEKASFEILFTKPDFSYSSTQIRKGLKIKDYIDESLYYLPACVYKSIIANKLYED
jgi:nicotinic acid mononucleotide adenylyltransferase